MAEESECSTHEHSLREGAAKDNAELGLPDPCPGDRPLLGVDDVLQDHDDTEDKRLLQDFDAVFSDGADTASTLSCLTVASTAAPAQQRDKDGLPDGITPLPKAAQALQRLSEIVNNPKFEDPLMHRPAELGSALLLGDAEHAQELADGKWGTDGEVVAVVAVMHGMTSMGPIYERLRPSVAFLAVEVDERHREPILGQPPFFERARSVAAFVAAQHAASPGHRGRVLLHCEDGLEYSACLAVASLMIRDRMHLQDAVGHVWGRRPSILQDASLRRQLVQLAAYEDLL